MSGHRAKIANERLKLVAGAMSTLSSAALILGVIRESVGGPRPADAPLFALPPGVSPWWIAFAFVGYAAALVVLGYIRPETDSVAEEEGS